MLEIKNLCINFGDTRILSDVNINIEENEIVGIVGESGSGKSTLLKAIIGILPKNANIKSGSIVFEGEELIGKSNMKYKKLRGNKISMIFQDAKSNMDPLYNVERAFYESISIHRTITKERSREIANKIFEDLSLDTSESIMKKYPFELSGGMAQRVSIAQGIANNPKLLLADEPTSALDVIVQKQVIDILKRLREKKNCGILIVSHNIGVIANLADKVAVMNHGKIVEFGEKTDVIYNPQDEYTRRLIKAVPKLRRNK